MTRTVPDAADRLAGCPGAIAEAAAALDALAWETPKGALRDRLLAHAAALDPDPVRKELRRAIGSEEWSVFRNLAGETEGPPLPAETAEFLGRCLLEIGREDAAVEFLERARLLHADRPVLAVLLARALRRLHFPRLSDAQRLLQVAQGLRPESRSLAAVAVAADGWGSDLDAFRARTGFGNELEWFPVNVTWSRVTGRFRRIWFSKAAVTEALMKHAGGQGEEAAPMVYDEDTVFVAESIEDDGKVFRTEAIRIRWPADRTEFLVFDAEGRRTNLFRHDWDLVPQVCAGCHLVPAGRRGYLPPMMNFPTEPEDGRIEIDERYRDAGTVLNFLEAFHCGSNLFGPYGAIWLSKLRADARDNKLSRADKPYYDRLHEKFAWLMDR